MPSSTSSDGVILVVDNYLFGGDRRAGHPLLARRQQAAQSTKHPIAEAVEGMGVKWVRHIDRTYDVGKMRDTLDARR